MARPHLIGFLALSAFMAAEARAQRDPAAVALLEAAIRAHQPRPETLQARLRYRGDYPMPGQGLRALGPFERYPVDRTLTVDEKANKTALRDDRPIAGFALVNLAINTPEGGVSVDPVMNSYAPLAAPPNGVANLLPHRRLRAILAQATRLRPDPSDASRIDFALASGASGTLSFDPATRLLVRFDMAPYSRVLGEEKFSFLYSGYRRVDGTAVPETYIARTENAVLGPQEEVARLVSVEPGAPAADFVLPSGVQASDHGWRKPAFSTTTLAPGVHLINNVTDSRGQWTYNVLAIVFEDHVMVAEAPISAAINARVLTEIEKVAPGKPIRHLVLSHHHDDHIEGIEPYVKRGVRLVTTSETAGLLHRIAQIRGASFGEPRIEVVSDRKVVRDRANEAHIYEIGPSPHSSQMLVVHLPRHGILYQIDFVNEGDHPASATTRTFLDWVEREGLRVDLIAGLHGRPVPYPRPPKS